MGHEHKEVKNPGPESTPAIFPRHNIYAESNRSRTACVMLVPDPGRIRVENLQNRIGSGLWVESAHLQFGKGDGVAVFVQLFLVREEDVYCKCCNIKCRSGKL